MHKTILAIDPGPLKSAYVLLNGLTIIKANYVSNSVMFVLIRDMSTDYSIIAVEGISYHGSKVGSDTFNTCEFAGRFYQCALDIGKPGEIIYRSQKSKNGVSSIRAFMTGSNSATAGQVDKAVKNNFPGSWNPRKKTGVLWMPKVDGKKNNHLLSAAAVALTYQGSYEYKKACILK